MTALQDVKDYLASVGVPAGRYSDAGLLQVLAVESANQSKACRVSSVDLPDGLSLQFRASDLDTLADGAAVSSWSSAVGDSVATQGVGSAQPTKRALDARVLVRGDGGDNLSLSGDALTWSAGLAGSTILARVKRSASTDRAVVGFSNNGAAASQRLSLRVIGGIWKLGGRRLDGDTFLERGTVAADQSVHTLSGVFNYAAATVSLWVDGVLDTTDGFQSAGITSATASIAASLLSQSDGTNQLFGDLYEFLAFSRALSDTERAAAEAYLDGSAAPWPLREALCRRVQVNLARRALPLGVIEQASDGAGPSFVPRNDPEVRRLEAPYRKLVVG